MLVCPSCGQENPEGFRFCGACAAPLGVEPRAEREERKVVSVLFCDLVGFTDRSDRADPEDVRATLRPYHARLKSEIERRGGTVEKFVGDAVMAVFGAPVAHEDDAERAVITALRIVDAIAELNETRPQLDLVVRAAVNTGEALVTLGARPQEGEGIVAGDVVNTAARLQEAAPVSGVVVGEMTYRATRHAIEYEELEPVALKGKAGALPLWRATGSHTRFGVDVPEASPALFVGREHELTLLRETYSRMLRESSVQLVTVTGEPGVGKSRLVAEFRSFVDYRPEIVFWRQGRCLPYGEGITFWALGEIVKGQAGILESDGPEEASGKLAASLEGLAEDGSEREWLEARLAPLVGLRGPDAARSAERTELFAAWRSYLEALASTRPLVLVFEDLHWADTALLEFVEYLVDWSAGVPLLVVCTARPELYERQAGWGGGKRNSTTLALAPLTGEETARLLSAHLSQAVLPAETQGALLERAGGNPLYAEEFVRMLTDRGLLTGEGQLRANGEIPVPETVQALIAARIDTLPPERKALLHDAAVVGKVFWAGAVASIGKLEEAVVREGLHELVRKELVRPARTSSVQEQAEFSFWHILVRDVAYQEIPRAARARKHRAAAKWIERIAEDRVSDHAEILAYHYEQGLELARAAGETGEIEELEEQARRFLVMAGDRATPLDVEQAVAYYRQALALYPDAAAERARVLLKAGQTVSQAPAGLTEAETYLQDALERFRSAGDELGAGEALLELEWVVWLRGQGARAARLLAEGTELLERRPPGRELALAYARRAHRDAVGSRPQECLVSSERALELVEKVDLRQIAPRVLQFRGLARCDLGDLGGLEDLREALRLSLESGPSLHVSTGYNNLGTDTWVLDSPARALELYQAGMEFAERRGLMSAAFWMRAESAWMLYDLGRWDELLDAADEVIDWDRMQGGSQHGVIALPYKAQVLLRRGETARAASLADEFLPRAREAQDPQVLEPALAVAALVERTKGDLPAAIGLVEEHEEALRDRSAWSRARFLPELLEICVVTGALDLGRRLIGSIDVHIGRTGHAVAAARAILAEAEGRKEEALDLHEQAARRWGDYGFVLGRGQSLLGAGRCRLALGLGDASSPLEHAHEIFSDLAARPLIEQTNALLEQAARQTA